MDDTLATARALGDSNRLRVVAVLMEHEELCVCQITALLGLATATVSRHMSLLHAAGLVQSRKTGRWVYYRLSGSFSPTLRQWLENSFSHSEVAQLDRDTVRSILVCRPGDPCRFSATRERPDAANDAS